MICVGGMGSNKKQDIARTRKGTVGVPMVYQRNEAKEEIDKAYD